MSSPEYIAPPDTVPPDYTPLTAPLSDAEVKAFRQQSKAEGAPWAKRPDPTGRYSGSLGTWIARLVPILVPLIGFLFVAGVVGPQLIGVFGSVRLFGDDSDPLSLIPLGILAVGVIVFLGLLVALFRYVRGFGYPKGWWEAALRLTRFARANGLVYGHEEPVAFEGSIFQLGEARVASRRLSSASGRPTEIGNYRYVIVSEDSEGHTSRTVYSWGYIAIRLDRRLPHMMLDARANDRSSLGRRVSNLPVSFAKDQVLSLEGDFDRHFTLYAPRQYERDALYVFTPDLMALLIDQTGAFDVEIVDDTLFVYSSGFDLLSPATYERMRAIVATVGAKAVSQTARYADERVGDRMMNEVAPAGRRLKRRGSPGVIVFGVAIVLWFVFKEFIAPGLGF